MKQVLTLILAAWATFSHAQQFQLETGDGTLSGPFEVKEGAVVAVGDNRATIRNVRSHREQVLDRMSRIRIPEVDFRGANIYDVVEFLRQASVEYDEKGQGVNLVLNIGLEDNEPLLDPFAASDEDDAFGKAAAESVSLVTFSALDITLKEALDIVVDVAGLKYRVQGSVIMIVPRHAPDGPIVYRMYDVFPFGYQKMLTLHQQVIHGQAGVKPSVKGFFAELGVSWPENTSIRYVADLGKLVVANTEANLDVLEKALSLLDVQPFQIEIEVQFVSFDATDISRLCDTGIDLASLTALWESGRGKLVAAPRVVTQSGQQATVKDVTEYIYPTEFMVYHNGGTNTNDTVVASVAEPGAFETREVGTILEVLPEAGAGGLLNLTLSPEIVEEPAWQEYGAKYVDSNGKEQQAHMPQPFFPSYNIRTNILVKDGETIMIGGGTPSRDGSRITYIFLTARRIGVSGESIAAGGNRE